MAIATGILTFAVLLFAEVLPKTFAALYPERIAFPSSVLLAPLQKVMFPLVWLLNGITSLTLRLFGIRTNVRISDAVSRMSCAPSCANPSRKSRRNQDMLISVLDPKR